jgi:hypothetical protein
MEIEKAKEILSRKFYLRQIDADEAERNGEKLMTSDDIRYLKEFKVESCHFKLLTVTPEKGGKLLKMTLEEKINESRVNEFIGIQISDREIYPDTMDTIKENNLFVSHNQEICLELTNYSYFFFDEEKQILNEIIMFQDFFGELSSVAHLI